MLDDLDHLRTHLPLRQLLTHYVHLAEPDREVWQDRLSSMDGMEPADMTKLHGDLLAFGWIEWTSAPKKSSACYRVTSDGLRALRLIGECKPETATVLAEMPTPKVSKRKREKEAA